MNFQHHNNNNPMCNFFQMVAENHFFPFYLCLMANCKLHHVDASQSVYYGSFFRVSSPPLTSSTYISMLFMETCISPYGASHHFDEFTWNIEKHHPKPVFCNLQFFYFNHGRRKTRYSIQSMAIEKNITLISLIATFSLVCTLAPIGKGKYETLIL